MYFKKFQADKELEGLQEELNDLNLEIKSLSKWSERFNIWQSKAYITLELALPESDSLLTALKNFCKRYSRLREETMDGGVEVTNEQVKEGIALLSNARKIITLRRDYDEDTEFQAAVTSAVTNIYLKKWWFYIPAVALMIAFIFVVFGVFEIRGYKIEVQTAHFRS